MSETTTVGEVLLWVLALPVYQFVLVALALAVLLALWASSQRNTER